jgi:hypothetical protein
MAMGGWPVASTQNVEAFYGLSYTPAENVIEASNSLFKK